VTVSTHVIFRNVRITPWCRRRGCSQAAQKHRLTWFLRFEKEIA
jgi:hypothetical protein